MSATQLANTEPPIGDTLPSLEPGDHLDQKTFHLRYEAMPEDVLAELIGGVVYMPSPLKAEHGDCHARLITWLSLYQASTLGTRALDNATVILAEDSEPQPDASLLILPENGGQTTESDDGYIIGPPELVAEVALSSESYDRHSKLRDYQRYGVREYLVLMLREQRAEWYVLEQGQYHLMASGEDGILRSPLFGGLWLDAGALLSRNTKRVDEVLQQGLASEEHVQFRRRLRGK